MADEITAPADTAPVTDEQRLSHYADWLRANKGRAGEPDFVQVADAYRRLRTAGVGDQPEADPYSVTNTAGRVGTNVAAGMVDTAGGAINAAADLAEKTGKFSKTEPTTISVPPTYTWRGIGHAIAPSLVDAPTEPVTRTFTGRVPSLAQGMRSTAGIDELPQDAPTSRRLAEAGLSALVPNARSILSIVKEAPTLTAAAAPVVSTVARNVVAPTVGSAAGGALGETLGGEAGGFIGSTLGGLGAQFAPRVATGAIERYYGKSARTDAPQIDADMRSIGGKATAGMLGNEDVQTLEKELAAQRGSSGQISHARESALGAIRNAADEAATARGSTDPQPTPGTIGQTIVDTADQARQGLKDRSSAAQQGMYDRTGNAPVNVAQTYAALRAEIGKTDSITAGPMVTRLKALEDMMPRDRNGQVVLGQNGEINVPLNQFKDWRGGLGARTQTLEPVPGNHLNQIYGPATDAMREAAVSQGVSPAEFDMAQNVTRSTMGSGGPAKYFGRIAGEEGTSGGQVGGMEPSAAFSHVIKGGEQNPQRLEQFVQHADPNATRSIMGDALRLRTQTTLGAGSNAPSNSPAIDGVRGGGAAGARQFSSWWENMHPRAQELLAGPQKPTMDKLSELTGAFNYPTRQTGLAKAVGGQTEGLAARIVGSEMLGNAASAMGLPSWVGRGVGMFGLIPVVRNIRARMLESDTARRGFTGSTRP
jgi:hypothetical protein